MNLSESYKKRLYELSGIEQKLNDNFWKWFGNSKVKDTEGNPIVVYHGTDKDFNTFEVREFGFHFGNKDQASLVAGSGNVMPVYLKLENFLYTIDFPRWEGYIMSKILHKYDKCILFV